MGAGCCGGYAGTRYAVDAKPAYDAARSYAPHRATEPLMHMHDFYRPKQHAPYQRAEDGHAAALLEDRATAKLTSPVARYGNARALYWNVSGV